MRVILVGMLVMMMAVADPAFGTDRGASLNCEPQPERQLLMSDEECEQKCCNSAAEFGLGLAAIGLNLVYTPFRMVYGLLGAEFGGIAGWASGGDMRASRGLWRPTVDGEYYIRPAHLDGSKRFRFSDATAPEPTGPRLVAPFTATLKGNDEPRDADLAVEAPPESKLGADESF